MKIHQWQARIANWKLTKRSKQPIEFHLCKLYEEVTECFGEIAKGNKPTDIYYKGGKPEGFPIELAQVVRQALYIAELSGIDLERAMEIDMGYQERRRAR